MLESLDYFTGYNNSVFEYSNLEFEGRIRDDIQGNNPLGKISNLTNVQIEYNFS